MTRAIRFSIWTVLFFASAAALLLVVQGAVTVPMGAVTIARILLFMTLVLGALALANALHERSITHHSM
jgi:hypothetical protein